MLPIPFSKFVAGEVSPYIGERYKAIAAKPVQDGNSLTTGMVWFIPDGWRVRFEFDDSQVIPAIDPAIAYFLRGTLARLDGTTVVLTGCEIETHDWDPDETQERR